MTLKLYMDVQVKRAVTDGLRRRGVDVVTAQEDDSATLEDVELLDRATSLDRVLFTCDDDFFAISSHRQHAGIPFAGVIYAHQVRVTIGQMVNDLEIFAKASAPDEMRDQVKQLPL